MNLSQSHNLTQTQTQKQALSQRTLQGIHLLQLGRLDLRDYLENKVLENPFLQLEVRESRTSGNKSQANDLSWIPDRKQSLFEYVTEQVMLTYRDTYLRTLIFWWINQLNDKGYVIKSLEEAVDETKAAPIQLMDALTLLQQLDPPGIGARNLQECLMLQTERREDAPDIAYLVLEESFDNLINRKWGAISKRYAVSMENIQAVFDFIQHLNPSPGAAFQAEEQISVRPDIIVTIKNSQLTIRETRYGVPILSFNKEYAGELEQLQDKEVEQYIKDKKKEYEVLQESLALRSETILRVSTAVVHRQTAFFFDEAHPLVPLQLKDIADELGLHESTISRAINDTYIQTASGIYELKHFFSRKAKTENEDALSTTSVQQMIQKLIDEEDKRKPLSDQKIVDLLVKEQIDISRRTVAKYRTELNIPATSKRKRFD
ncbi:RNA polymerase factor sigma-54 [Trichococcus collinsii]|uniref:RNA polymerase, sigma 54 subunit, RpoN/SigL n=1 Tax=Trichococcus collinsii TaxID=157076 RepID=A0AB38A1I4_9LACT|nr:RNA polymerase factor sigma-54 [Trichococcus collinsii]CZQ95354.1 rna polymerase sigma factor 54 [Trichococcus collinsii]SEA65745.1 RNA polymerase, sigma 54 subunit, RpoN/SigL [Trichococcus collinsii]